MSDSSKKVLEVLLNLASQKRDIPYSDICSQVDMNEEDLEDCLTTFILEGKANIKLDQKNKMVISRMNPFVFLAFYYIFFIF